MKKVSISGDFYLCAALMLLILPIRWVIGFYLAALIHESLHFLTAALFSIRIHRIELRSTGAYMEISPHFHKEEFICSLAGPLGGILAAKCFAGFPELAICAFSQSIVNLMPIYPLDGGRMLRCVLETLFSDHTAEVMERIVGSVFVILLSAGLVFVFVYLDLVVFSLIGFGAVVGKWMKNTLQTRRRGGTIYLPKK